MNSASRISAPISWISSSIARYPALLAASCLAGGVFLGDVLESDSGVLLITAVVMSFLSIVLSLSETRKWRVIGVVAIYLTLIALGSWRIALTNSDRPSESINQLTASSLRVNIFARVDGVPFQKSSGWRVPLDMIAVKGQSGDLPVNGRVLLTSIAALPRLHFGDYIRFDGRVFAPSVQRNPGGFDYAEYLHRQGFDATVRPESQLSIWPQEQNWSFSNIVSPVRQWIRGTFAQNFNDDSQALLVGLLLGDTDRLPKPISDAFRESGTSHLLAVSGANVWLVVGMILMPMYALSVPRWPRTLIALVVVVLFSFLTRNEPSVVRASLMVALILAGRLLWRPVAPLNAVGAAALIILLTVPAHLFRPGFQLSFAAVIGILVAVGRIEPLLRGFWRKRWVYTAVLFVVASLAATLATAALSAWHFGTVAVAGSISNLIMVPLAGVTAHLGLLLLPVQAVSSTGTAALVWAIDMLLSFSTSLAQTFAGISWATLSWQSPSLLTLGHFVIGMILALNWRHRFLWLRPVTYYVCIAIGVTALLRFITPVPSIASITLLDSGSQRVAVLTSKQGLAVGLIDDPGLDDDIDQWVVRPFLRHQIGEPLLHHWTPWRRLEGTLPRTSGPAHRAPSWKRICIDDDTDSLGRPRVWVDLWHADSSEIVMFRDSPEVPLARFQHAISGAERPTFLILPAQAKVGWVREVVDRSKPRSVVLFGRAQHGRSPEETIAFWQLKYPKIDFYSTALSGGITLGLLPDKVSVQTTIPFRASLVE